MGDQIAVSSLTAREPNCGHKLQTGAELQEFEHGGLVTSVALSACGKNLATGCRDKKARVFDLETGAKLQEFEHGGLVWSVALSACGKPLTPSTSWGTMPPSSVMMAPVAWYRSSLTWISRRSCRISMRSATFRNQS